MAEVKPMTTTDAAGKPGAGQQHTDEQALRAKVYDLRRNSDPTLYDRVVAFHPHAATSDEAFATFKADLERATEDAAKRLAEAAPEKPAP